MTETVFALGRGASLVGRTAYCDFPSETASIEAIGGPADPSAERIVALAPSLVLGDHSAAGRAIGSALEAAGVPTYFPKLDSIAEVLAMFVEAGARLDANAQGASLESSVRRALDAVRAATRSVPKPRVAFVLDWNELVVVGAGSFVDELVAAAGGRNVATTGGPYPRLSREGLASLDPEVLIDGSPGHSGSALEIARSLPGAEAIAAIKNGRVVALRSSASLRPGPRIGAAARELAVAIHGEGVGASIDAHRDPEHAP
jgi:iron complex transport system substrate-binding protein